MAGFHEIHRPREATYEDLLAVPDHRVAELIGGELVTSPRPARAHARAGTAIIQDLRDYDGPVRPGRPGGWWISYEPELHLGRDVLVPDLTGWRLEGLSELTDAAHWTQAPDWICEILSPRQESRDRVRKMPIYAREGVGYAWLVDPIERLVEVYRLVDGAWLLLGVHEGDAPVRLAPFEALELDLSRWWMPTPAADSPGPEQP